MSPERVIFSTRCERKLEGTIGQVSYNPSESSDLHVKIGQTVLETRIGAWAARIGDAVK